MIAVLETEKIMFPAPTNAPKKVEKMLCWFKAHSVTKANILFYPKTAAFTNSSGVTRNKEEGIKEPI